MTSISKAERFFGLSSLHRGAAQFRVISAGQWVACKGPLSASMVLQSDTREAVVFSRVFCAGVSNGCKIKPIYSQIPVVIFILDVPN